jgi:cytochrome c biogenesis protein
MNLIKKKLFQQSLKRLANLQLAISLLFLIGILIALGTFIEQDQTLAFYKENYSTNNPILGFVTWKLITSLQLNQIYTSYWFIILLAFFGTTLISCTFTTQLPSLKQFRLWRFIKDNSRLKTFNSKGSFPRFATNGILYYINKKSYHTFRQGEQTYAYSGLLGRFAPIIVHFSILILLLGSTIGSLNGYTAQEVIPRGEIFHIQNLIKSGTFGQLPQNFSWRVNDFWITYTKEFKINQFYSDLSLLDKNGSEIKRKTIFVNEPFVYNGLTLYQTDWNILGIKFKFDNNKFIQVPLKKISKQGRTFWFGSIAPSTDKTKKLSLIVNDLRGSVFFYDAKGKLIKECLLGERFFIDKNSSIEFYDFITSTGLQIKIDPGIKTVYFSFFLLMISTYVSFISYSQIWGVEEKGLLVLAGKSNRAVLYFQEEFRKIQVRVKN